MIAARDSYQFPLRLPEGMREKMQEIASNNGRSMNSEIVTILDREIRQRLETQKADAQA
ncbi:MAG: Arc family DNA-binding protein [Rhizobium sp.]|nr:Arc family DNA-binding protein [Rhizobium sp.]